MDGWVAGSGQWTVGNWRWTTIEGKKGNGCLQLVGGLDKLGRRTWGDSEPSLPTAPTSIRYLVVKLQTAVAMPGSQCLERSPIQCQYYVESAFVRLDKRRQMLHSRSRLCPRLSSSQPPKRNQPSRCLSLASSSFNLALHPLVDPPWRCPSPGHAAHKWTLSWIRVFEM